MGYYLTLPAWPDILTHIKKLPDMFDKDMQIAGYDDELWAALQGESQRQEDHIELIASENYASPRVMQAQGSVLTNKYAEGYPAKRYYGGCEYVDVAEQLAIDRAKELFKADYANVQPHSGSQANMAVYLALGGLPRPVTAGRYHSRYEPGCGWTPDAWVPCELLRQDIQCRAVRLEHGDGCH
jgi:hypothetical protein